MQQSHDSVGFSACCPNLQRTYLILSLQVHSLGDGHQNLLGARLTGFTDISTATTSVYDNIAQVWKALCTAMQTASE
jgi:hypothetical protein